MLEKLLAIVLKTNRLLLKRGENMRRKDREMNRDFGLKIIDKSSYGVISMIDIENKPYSLPLSIVRDEDMLYFHSAKQGKKVDLLKNDSHVRVVFVGATNIPENFSKDELEEMSKDSAKATTFISKVFTTEFESAVVSGKVNIVENREEKTKALKLICEKYTPDKMDYFHIAIKAGLDKTNIYSIKIEKLTSKRKKYDINHEEMKWERVE